METKEPRTVKGEDGMAFRKGDTARFRLDDTDDPGWARVRILATTEGILGLPTYRVEVLEVLKAGASRSPRRGSKLTVAAVDLGGETRLFPDPEVTTADHGN